MTLTRKLDIAAISILLFTLIAAAYLYSAQSTAAGPSSLYPYCYSNSQYSSTSPAFMSPGVGTTTLTCNLAAGTSNIPDSFALLLQLTASTTATKLNTNFEYSMNGVDWYQDMKSERATTTPALSLSVAQSLTWQFASSTPGLGAVPSNNNRDHRLVQIQNPPTTWVRAVFTLPIGSANGAVYAELVGKTQNQ